MASKKPGASIVMEKVKPEIVLRYLQQFGLDQSGTLAEQVARLQQHQAKIPKKEIGDCEDCGGASDLRLPTCVYCGAGDDEAQLQTAVASNPNATRVPDPEPETEPEVIPGPAKARSQAKRVKDQTTAIVAGKPETGVTVQNLDDNVREIRFLQREAIVSYWRLGRALYTNFKGRLYTQRLDDQGRTIYKAFNQFVHAELGITPGHAYRMMDAAVNFTEQDVAEYGVTKLALVAKVPEADRSEILRRIRDTGASRDEVADEVRRLVGGTRKAPSAAQQAGSTRGGKMGERKPREKEITVGVVLGKKTIVLVRRDAPDKQAATFQHQPYCEEQMLNGVVTTYRVIKTETGLSLVIERRREATDDAGASSSKRAARAKKPGRPSKKK